MSEGLRENLPEALLRDSSQFTPRGDNYLRVSVLMRIPKSCHFDELFGVLQEFEQAIFSEFQKNNKIFEFDADQWGELREKYEAKIMACVSGVFRRQPANVENKLWKECHGVLWDSLKYGTDDLLHVIHNTSSGDLQIRETQIRSSQATTEKTETSGLKSLSAVLNARKTDIEKELRRQQKENGHAAGRGGNADGDSGPTGVNRKLIGVLSGVTLLSVLVGGYFSSRDKSNVDVHGCMNKQACNFDSTATNSDESCVFAIGICQECKDGEAVLKDANKNRICDDDEKLGCTNPTAFNYSEEATLDDGSCVDIRKGCMDKNATNFDKEANTPSDDCIFKNESPLPPTRTENDKSKRTAEPPVSKYKAVQSAIPGDPEERAKLFYELMSSDQIIKQEHLNKANLRNLILPQMRGWESHNSFNQAMGNGNLLFWKKKSIALGQFCLFADLKTYDDREQFNKKLSDLMFPSKEKFDDAMLEPSTHPYSWCDCKDNLKRLSSELSKQGNP